MTLTLPDRYVDARLVARGGMGEVWHARDSRLDRDVAIKVLASGPGVEDEQVRRARFEREARVVAQLSAHPGVVTVYDIGDIDGHPFLAMEWMGGGTLAERLRDPRGIPTSELLMLLDAVAAALDAAHEAGIVHRDVKPGNIMFDSAGSPRIGDFGIATYEADPAMTLTQAGAVVGTSGYIAPEQATGAGAVPASDQYALMGIAFEALTGERPFARDGVIAELAAHASDPIPSASARAPHLPLGVDDVFRCGLAKDPAARYPDCRTAIDALRHELEYVAPTVAAPVAPARGMGTAPVGAHVRSSSSRTRVRVGIAAAALLVAMLALLAARAIGDGDEQSPKTTDTPATTATTEQPAETTEEPAATEPAEPTEPTEPTAEQVRDAAIARNDDSFRALQAGDYQQAYDLGMSALGDLAGVEPWEAFANYNVGAALVGLGRCAEAVPYLDRSEQLQGQRDEIDAAREQANACISGESDGKPGKGKGRKDKRKK